MKLTLRQLINALEASGAPDDAIVFIEQTNGDDEPRQHATEVITGYASDREHVFNFSEQEGIPSLDTKAVVIR